MDETSLVAREEEIILRIFCEILRKPRIWQVASAKLNSLANKLTNDEPITLQQKGKWIKKKDETTKYLEWVSKNSQLDKDPHDLLGLLRSSSHHLRAISRVFEALNTAYIAKSAKAIASFDSALTAKEEELHPSITEVIRFLMSLQSVSSIVSEALKPENIGARLDLLSDAKKQVHQLNMEPLPCVQGDKIASDLKNAVIERWVPILETAENDTINPYPLPTKTDPKREFDTYLVRNQLLDEFRKCISAGDKGHMHIIGRSKIGKSAFANYLSKKEQGTFKTIYFPTRAESKEDFYSDFAEQLAPFVHSGIDTITKLLPSHRVKPALVSLKEHLRRFFKKNGQVYLVLIIDEFESYARSEEFGSGFFETLWNIAKEPEFTRLRYVTLSTRRREEFSNWAELHSLDFWSLFRSLPLEISEFSDDEVELLLGRGGNTFDEADKIAIRNLGGHHPMRLKIVCHYFFEHKRDKIDLKNPIASLSAAEREALTNEIKKHLSVESIEIIINFRDQKLLIDGDIIALNQREKVTFLAIAELSMNDERDFIPKDDISAFLREKYFDTNSDLNKVVLTSDFLNAMRDQIRDKMTVHMNKDLFDAFFRSSGQGKHLINGYKLNFKAQGIRVILDR